MMWIVFGVEAGFGKSETSATGLGKSETSATGLWCWLTEPIIFCSMFENTFLISFEQIVIKYPPLFE